MLKEIVQTAYKKQILNTKEMVLDNDVYGILFDTTRPVRLIDLSTVKGINVRYNYMEHKEMLFNKKFYVTRQGNKFIFSTPDRKEFTSDICCFASNT
jgi:hypothetical protein